MKLLLLGTGASEGIPGLCSEDRVSEYARSFGGRDRRTRTGALVDDALKIDYSPDTFSQLTDYNQKMCDWSGLLVTHSHADHLVPAELQYALYPFTENLFMPFPIYGNDLVLSKIAQQYPDWPMELVETVSFHPFLHADYKISPLRAYHGMDEECQNYLISHDGKTLLYATDTGIWEDETWRYLAGHEVNCLVIECTNGFVESDYKGHLNLRECVGMVERLHQIGTLSKDSRVITTHHSSQGDATHAELELALRPHGMEPGYDGMVLEF